MYSRLLSAKRQQWSESGLSLLPSEQRQNQGWKQPIVISATSESQYGAACCERQHHHISHCCSRSKG